MHQRSWLAVKPIRKSSPPPATPPMLGRWAPAKNKNNEKTKNIILDQQIKKQKINEFKSLSLIHI